MEDHSKVISHLVTKVTKRIAAGGGAVCREDLMQEAIITDLKAQELFRQNAGASIATYCSRAVLNRLNQIADKELYRARHESALSEQFEFEVKSSPEKELIAEQSVVEFKSDLSALSSTIVDWLASPPEFVSQEVARRGKLLSVGAVKKREGSTLTVIIDLLGNQGQCGKELKKSLRELKAKAAVI